MYLAMLKNACNTANYQRINFLPGVKWNQKIMKKIENFVGHWIPIYFTHKFYIAEKLSLIEPPKFDFGRDSNLHMHM